MTQIDMFGSKSAKDLSSNANNNLIVIENGEYIFYPDFLQKLESDSFFHQIRDNSSWKQESMNMYGRRVNFPRLTAWHGDNDKPYSFSGITLKPLPWTPELLDIKNKIELISGAKFNSVLLNFYRDGSDYISWHTDAEKELGINPVIASVNFGATRRFQLKHIRSEEKVEIKLTHGSLLVMQGELQHFWKHQIVKTKKPTEERVNLTFRFIK